MSKGQRHTLDITSDHTYNTLFMRLGIQSIEDVTAILSEEGRVNVGGLEGGAFAYLASRIWVSRKKPVLVVCSNASEAGPLREDINYFAKSISPGPVEIFPAPAALPYTHLIPQSDTWIERLSVLHTIENEDAPLIIAPIEALLRKVPPKELYYDHIGYVSIGQKLQKDAFLAKLVSSGYSNSPLVEDQGDFASRGYIIDVWSPVSDRPVRIELDGDSVASIRSFDPATQRTSFSAERVTIIPVRSVMLDEEVIKNGLIRLKARADDCGISPVERREYANSVKSGIYPAYTETLLPIFHPSSGYLFDYLHKDTIVLIFTPSAVRESYLKFWGELCAAYNEAGHVEKAVRPEDLYMSYDNWLGNLAERKSVTINDVDVVGEKEGIQFNTFRARPVEGWWIEGTSETALTNFVARLNSWLGKGLCVVVVCHAPMQADRLIDLLRWQGLAPVATDRPFAEIAESSKKSIYITVSDLSQGFVWPDTGLVVLTEKEMFGKKRRRLPHTPKLPTEAFASYQDLEEGNYLVHIQHGVGRYKGMVQMDFGGMRNDFLRLEYLGGDKLYVPAYRLNLVQKYVGPGDNIPFLDKLGGTRWERAKLKANRAVRKMASELLKLYAVRKIQPGFAFSGSDHLMEEFEAAFPYDETPDQMQSIEDVLRDMSESHPADRLICGDVGYGKTEVAMRAAFKAAMDGKQVALLIPTTILAFQHFENFKERFKGTAVTIELLNRFRSRKEQSSILEGLGRGTIDIVIGTHRLIQADVKYRDLGLLIVDEEHRFGVRQKEAIKKLKATVDVISMTATPIPRTLHISLVGVRDISIINTPPADRHSIRTYVAEFDEGLIRGAILKEIQRGGQVFFVHNRVETIDAMKERLSRLVPEARICVAHGQMREHQLEKVMVGFLKKEYDVLLTTTIIESGLDIQNANTIIVNRADTFGLAQLYQLRGRVGRSSIQAYAYLLIPEKAAVTSVATKRLAVLQRYTELGSGFQIAMHDLEIRGSGNILGAEQSGHVSAIGYELYTELLEQEIGKLKGEPDSTMVDTEIQIPIEAYLPSSYIEDSGTRIVVYKRISALKNEAEIDALARELEDRFGKLPEPAINLFKIMEIKTAASGFGIESIQMNKGIFVYKFSGETTVTPGVLIDLVKKNQERMKIRPSSTVIITEDMRDDIFSLIRRHLATFADPNPEAG